MFWFGFNEYICIFAVTVLEAEPSGKLSYHTTYLEKKETFLSHNLLGEKANRGSHNLLGEKSNRPITQPIWRKIKSSYHTTYLEKKETVLSHNLLGEKENRPITQPT